MLRIFHSFGIVLFATLYMSLGGCGDDGSDDDNTGDCPSIEGTWEITAHCSSSVIGTTMTFVQSGCIIEQIKPWPDWSGSVDESGNMIWSGPADQGETMVCNATLSGDTITSSCSPPCDVTAVRE